MGSIQKVEKTELAVASAPQPQIGEGAIEAKDILIPKILLMQPISDFVAEGKFAAGAFVRSTDHTLVVDKDKKFDFIPLQFFKRWAISRRQPGDSRGEFAGIEPYTAENCNAPYEWTQDGMRYDRSENLCFYGLIGEDVKREAKAFEKAKKTGELPDADDCLLPCLVVFQRTSKKAGQVIVSHFSRMDDFGARLGQTFPRYSDVFSIGSEFVKGDKGNYYIFTVEKSRKASEDEKAAARRWSGILSAAKSVVVDDSDLEEAAAKEVRTPEILDNEGRDF